MHFGAAKLVRSNISFLRHHIRYRCCDIDNLRCILFLMAWSRCFCFIDNFKQLFVFQNFFFGFFFVLFVHLLITQKPYVGVLCVFLFVCVCVYFSWLWSSLIELMFPLFHWQDCVCVHILYGKRVWLLNSRRLVLDYNAVIPIGVATVVVLKDVQHSNYLHPKWWAKKRKTKKEKLIRKKIGWKV